jgi:hypothetical protein
VYKALGIAGLACLMIDNPQLKLDPGLAVLEISISLS